MIPHYFEGDSRKRKLDYPKNKPDLNAAHITKNQIFKSSYATKKLQETEWERAAEGFSGFTSCDRPKSTKRRSLTARRPENYKICMPCDTESEGDLEVENDIKWNSSDEELSPVSDLESNAEMSDKNNQGKANKNCRSNQNDSPVMDRIDSDVESEEFPSDKDSCTPRKKLTEQNEAYSIEDADSRSLFTFSGSNLSKNSKKETDSEENVHDIEILSSTDASATSSSPSQRSKVKASDWVKSLDLKTPTKQSQNEMPSMTEDSAKKKKKYSRNSMADQLSKLQIRERSAVRMWNHQTPLDEKASSKSVLVEVIEYEMLYSLQMAKCKQIKDTANTVCYVIFSAEMTEELNISVGTVVRIFPPWQKLVLQSLQRTVILCTNYIKIEEIKTTSPKEQEHKIESPISTLKWKCPCVSGLVKDHKLCPAFQFPCVPGVFFSQETKSSSGTPQSELEHSLYTVHCTQPTCNVSDSILESIDKSSLYTGISFKALVHRVFYNYDIEAKTNRHKLLVEDGHGIMCLILLPDDSDGLYKGIITQGEGRSYVFSGLRVLSRTTRDRDPTMFSLIDCVWSGLNVMAHSEDSETASVSNMSQVLPPGFYYSMLEHSTSEFSATETTTHVSQYKKTPTTPLCEMKEDTDTCQRFSCVVDVIAELCNSDLPNSMKIDYSRLLYVKDSTLDENTFKTVKVKESCCIHSTLKCEIFLRDILLINGNLVCDGYSQIITDSINKEQRKTRKKSRPCLPKTLDEHSDTFNLCTVKGMISEIDESSAYSWEVCDKCGQDKLAEKANNGELVCFSCKRVVKTPVTRMKMEVYIMLPHLKTHKVKVDLLEDTIKSLLPEDNDDDEGYDIGTVQNAPIGPILCVLIQKRNMEIFLKEIKTFS